MLQVIIEEHQTYSLPEQAQMAIEGGARWLLIRPGNLSDHELREATVEIAALCRENTVILTIEGHTELAGELGLHGVLLMRHHADPVKIREFFGPEAIIGAEVSKAEEVLPLERADVDYLVLHHGPEASMIIAEARQQGALIPFVAMGTFSVEESRELIARGFSGVCTGRRIFDSDNPEEETRRYLDALKNSL